VAEDIDVSLHQGHRLGEDVVAGADQVYVEHRVVAHDAEYALVVVRRRLRTEGHYDSRL
jgi:hypothetical protein